MSSSQSEESVCAIEVVASISSLTPFWPRGIGTFLGGRSQSEETSGPPWADTPSKAPRDCPLVRRMGSG